MAKEHQFTLIIRDRKCHLLDKKGHYVQTFSNVEELKEYFDILILLMPSSK